MPVMRSTPEDCVICCHAIGQEEVPLDCGHRFHTSCLETWLARNPSCPMCREDASGRVVLACEVCDERFSAGNYTSLEAARAAHRDHLLASHGIQESDEHSPFGHLSGFERIHAELTSQVLQSQTLDPSLSMRGCYVCPVCSKAFHVDDYSHPDVALVASQQHVRDAHHHFFTRGEAPHRVQRHNGPSRRDLEC